MPVHGYTRLFERMLAHPRVQVMLNTDFRDGAVLLPWRHIVYTGPIDAFFDHRHSAGRAHASTSLVYDPPRADGGPDCPVPRSENATLYRRYEADAESCPHVTYVDRPASDKYYNRDPVVARALATYERMATAAAAAPMAG